MSYLVLQVNKRGRGTPYRGNIRRSSSEAFDCLTESYRA